MMVVNGMERISTPWRLRWHRFRYTTLPLLGLVSFTVLTLLLWTRQGEMPHAIGEVEAIRVDVASPLSGILMPLPQGPWSLYETVEPNQVLAQLDDRPLQAQLATLVQELARLRKELDALGAKLAVSEADRGLNYMADAVRLRVELEQRGLVVLERGAEVAVNRLEAQRRSVYFDCLKPLYDKKIVSEIELNNARMLRDEAVKRLAENSKVLGEAETQKKGALARLEQLPKFLPADVAKELAPIAAAILVQQARIREVEVDISRLTIRAPIRGMISAIHHWPQSAVRADDPIITLAADQGRYLVSFIRQEQHVNPKVGMDVDVRKRAAISPTVRTVVEQVGPQVELIPVHLCRDPKMPEWGLPVRITLPKDFAGRPGELFEVTFKTRSKGNG
jgi:multidrug resistance efflux pump